MSSLYSWSRFAGRSIAASLGSEGKPLKLTFVVTKRCHSRCVYCDIWKVKDTPGALEAELSLQEVQALAQANPFLQWIDFTGGEPTDRPDFVQVVQAFAAACPDLLLVHFPTNGLGTARIHDAVVQLRATVRARLIVSVSLDGPPELNDRLRGVRNDFDHAIDTFAAVRAEIGPENTYFGMTLHGHKAACGRTTAELIDDSFAAVNEALSQRRTATVERGALHLNIPHFSPHYYGNQTSEAENGFGGAGHRAEISEALTAATAKSDSGSSFAMRVIERIYRSEAQRYLANGRTRIVCSALQTTAYLSEKGEVYPCTIWDKPLGNVRNTGYRLMPIIERSRRDGVRQAVASGRCPNCWTPCEAYPSILVSPLRSALTLIGRR